MEMRREKTLSGLFLKYVMLFCLNTILLAIGVFLLALLLMFAGFLLPANYAEIQLSENTDRIRSAGGFVEEWIPKGCTYGVYSAGGEWLKGSFAGKEQESAWAHYEQKKIYAEYKGYYRFIPLDDGNVCIVKYYLIMRYANDWLNGFLPAPEILMPILDLVLFILNGVLLSKGFAEKVKKQLWELSMITDKIAGNDLDFETKPVDIKEINEIMISLGRMKDTLQESLKAQWDMEKQKQEQLAALAHDVKTPLTIIKGNAELLKESALSKEDQECTSYILENTESIENYIGAMKQVIRSTGRGAVREKKTLRCGELSEMLKERARQFAAAEKIPAAFDAGKRDFTDRNNMEEECGERGDFSEGLMGREDIVYCEKSVHCNTEDILRAWDNLISNGAEYTDRQKGIRILVEPMYREKQWYLLASVRDYGSGFSQRDLRYADQEFYSGDASRHDRRHSGLGLSIAKKFAAEQGGFLEYGNCRDGEGAETALWVKMEV